MVDLHPLEIKVLTVLRQIKAGKVDEIAEKLKIEPVSVSRAAHWLQSKGLVDIRQETKKQAKISDRGKKEAGELPERALVNLLKKGPKKISEIKDIDMEVALGRAKKKNWISIQKGMLKLIGDQPELPIERDLKKLKKGNVAPKELEAFNELKERGLIEVDEKLQIEVKIKSEGEKVDLKEKKTELSEDLIRTGAWKKTQFRAYDVKAPVPTIYAARLHPMRMLIEKIRRIFFDMGFEEGVGPFVESAFWDMDVLFVPQDHPAREMQDTFYMKTPAKAKLPDDKPFLKLVKKAQEEGIGGSKGWGIDFSFDESMRTLLRTHTTAVSARYLYGAKPPKKVFCIGKVFRNETMDYKHLAELHQVEGIVFDPDVSFRDHQGYLKEFFNRLGFPKVRFRPAYFPYTEMSMECEVWFEPTQTWLEMGGSGIFRPELVEPLTAIDSPVLAWGLGLDRLAMVFYGFDDIRTPFKNQLDWTRSLPMAGGNI
jgi:phenylalanyl-tRNA synthetase alpha chain